MRPRIKGNWFNRSKLAAVLVALLSVTVATIGVRYSEPPEFESSRGSVGQTVDFCGGELTVQEVQVGTQLTEDGEVTISTEGLFIALKVHLAAPRDKTVASAAKLLSGEYEYEPYGFGIVNADAGYETTAELIFIVDPAHIDDLTLEVWQNESVYSFQEHAVIGLGISDRNAGQWREAGDGQSIEVQANPETRAIS